MEVNAYSALCLAHSPSDDPETVIKRAEIYLAFLKKMTTKPEEPPDEPQAETPEVG